MTYALVIDYFSNSNEFSNNFLKCLNYVYQNFLIFSYCLVKYNDDIKLKQEIEKKILYFKDVPDLYDLLKENNTNLLSEINKNTYKKNNINELFNYSLNHSKDIVLANLQKLANVLNEEQKSLDKNIDIIKIPYLPMSNKKYTLVLDLDETLIHYVEEENTAFVQVRPNTDIFLAELNKYYEIVIFTAAMSDV